MPEVDAVIGTNELERITALCEGLEPRPEDPLEPYLYHDPTPRVLATPRHYAYIKIAEGCDHPCTFCVIPQYRGKFRSRRFESVISEATRLFSQGVREINLIGQDTTCYGEDLGIKDGLALLLARLAEIETPHPKWVRFLYCYPNKVTQKLLDTIAAHEALVKYIDMPLQHASAAVLKRMKRGANGDIFLKLIERIRRTIPGVAIRTSMIAGFPGETEADFETLCEFVKAAQFDRLGVFSYSDEDTSASFALDGKVDARDIYDRKRRLMAHSAQDLPRAQSRTGGARVPGAGGRSVARFRTGLASAAGFASARNRRRLLHLRSGRISAPSRTNSPHADHRGARLRPDGRVDRCSPGRTHAVHRAARIGPDSVGAAGPMRECDIKAQRVRHAPPSRLRNRPRRTPLCASSSSEVEKNKTHVRCCGARTLRAASTIVSTPGRRPHESHGPERPAAATGSVVPVGFLANTSVGATTAARAPAR